MIQIRELLPEETAQLAQLEAQNHPSPWSEAHFKAACTLNAQRILLEVRASNTAAQQLYRKHGFVQIATRKNYYGGTEDAWIMEKLC